MNEKIAEKFKDTEFLKKILVLPDKEKVKEEFKKEGLEVEDKDLKEIGDLIKCSVEVVSNLSSEELEKVSAGFGDGVVYTLSKKLNRRAGVRYYDAPGENFNDKLADHSDKVVEAGLVSMIAGLSIGGTLGIQKLIKTGKEKGWWTKDYWIKKK